MKIKFHWSVIIVQVAKILINSVSIIIQVILYNTSRDSSVDKSFKSLLSAVSDLLRFFKYRKIN